MTDKNEKLDKQLASKRKDMKFVSRIARRAKEDAEVLRRLAKGD